MTNPQCLGFCSSVCAVPPPCCRSLPDSLPLSTETAQYARPKPFSFREMSLGAWSLSSVCSSSYSFRTKLIDYRSAACSVLLVRSASELTGVKRDKFPDAHRRPASHPLHAVRQAVIPTRPVQLGHGNQMPGQVLRQPRPFQLTFPIFR